MDYKLLASLQEGGKFPFSVLADSLDETDAFFESWWEGREMGTIAHPLPIADNDPILEPTDAKTRIDLVTYRDVFHKHLFDALESGRIIALEHPDRQSFRNKLVRIVACNSLKSEGQPRIIFAGGGYGSGKSTALIAWTEGTASPFTRGHMIGVDVFKFYIPEFGMIQAVGDGRASVTVQKECVALSEAVFERLIENGRSFIWDSSMSNEVESNKKIQRARDKGYTLSMLAVFTPEGVAIRQAMERAKDFRRFPNKTELPKSHVSFRKAFTNYIPKFDEIKVFANIGDGNESVLVAEKEKNANDLAIIDANLFTTVSM